MTPTPSGRLVRTPAGRDLVLTRTFRAPIEDVWASITESERTARWFGSWTGEPGPGRTVLVTMGFEAGAEPQAMRIDACEAPRHLALSSESEHGNWRLEAHLTESGGVTEMRFTHHLEDGMNVGDMGPGWEYYRSTTWTCWPPHARVPRTPSGTTTTRPRRRTTRHRRRPNHGAHTETQTHISSLCLCVSV